MSDDGAEGRTEGEAQQQGTPGPRITITLDAATQRVTVNATGFATLDYALAALEMARLALEDARRAAQQQGPRVALAEGRVPAPAVQELLRRR